MKKNQNKDLILSLVCGFMAALFFLFIIFNKNFSEIEKLPFLRTYYWVFLIFFPLSFFLVIKTVFFIGKLFPNFFIPIFQLVKFLEIGVLNTFIDIGSFNFLVNLTGIIYPPKLLFLNGIAFSLAVINSYFWNKNWTFGVETKTNKKEFSVFLIISLTALFINSLIVYLGTTFLEITFVSKGAFLNIVKILATFVAMLWNFLGYKFIVFKK